MFGKNTKEAKKLFDEFTTNSNALVSTKNNLDVNKIMNKVKPLIFPTHFSEENLEKLLGKKGIIYYLWKSAYTNTKGNFTKLVYNNVKDENLKIYLLEEPLASAKKDLKKILDARRNNIYSYLTLTKQDDANGRKKHKDASEKMADSRLVERMKVISTAFIVCLIDKRLEQFNQTKITESSFINKDFKTLDIPDNITEIASQQEGPSFCNFKNLERVHIGKSVTEIGFRAFSDCKQLKALRIDSAKTGEHAFIRCKNLETLVIGSNVSEISFSSFSDCEKLKHVFMGQNVKTIGKSAFYNCKALESITIPEKVTAIDYGTFKNCENLKAINIQGKIEYIDSTAFEGCDKLENLTSTEQLPHELWEAIKNHKTFTVEQ